MSCDTVPELILAPATADNLRTGEAAIAELTDGSRLVGWIDDRPPVTYFTNTGGHPLKLKSLPWEWFYGDVG